MWNWKKESYFWIAWRDAPTIRSVSALLRFGLMARASLGGYVSSLISTSGWLRSTIIVPLDLREPSLGRVVSDRPVVRSFWLLSPSDVMSEAAVEDLEGVSWSEAVV